MLFDHLVGALQGCFRNCEVKRLGGLEVKGKLEQGWLRAYPVDADTHQG